MKKITLLSVMAMLCLNFWAFSQSNDTNKTQELGGLKPGDTLGVFSINKVYSPESKNFETFSNSETKGKFIILDFWATWCSTCIGRFKHLNKIQQAHLSDLEIILVNTSSRDTDAKVISFMENYYRENKDFHMRYALRDKKLNLLFPVRALPHYVWIGTDGVIKAITGWEELTAQNVQLLLANQPLHLNTKNW